MANIKDIIDNVTSGGKGFGKDKLGGAGIRDMAGAVKELGTALDNAIDSKDVKKIQEAMTSMSQAKTIKANVEQLKKYRKKMEEVNKAIKESKKYGNKTQLGLDYQELKKITKQIGELEEETNDLSDAFNEINENKFFRKMKEMGKEKWMGFVTGAAAVGFFGRAMHNLESASKLQGDTLQSMPLTEVAARYDTINSGVLETESTFSKFGKTISSVGKYHREFGQESLNAITLQTKLKQSILTTGASVDELTSTYQELESRFRLQATLSEENTMRAAKLTEGFTLMGNALGIGVGSAIEFAEKRVKKMGGTLEDSQKILAGVALNASELQTNFDGIQMTTKDYTEAVLRSSDADVRSSQNIRIKNAIMKNTIETMIRQGRTQEEAMQAGEAAVAAAVGGSDTMRKIATMELAEELRASAMKIKGETDLAKRKELTDKLMSKFTAGMSPEEKAKATIKLEQQVADIQAGNLNSNYSLAAQLESDLGSQRVGIEKLRMTQYDKYSDIKDKGDLALILKEKGEYENLDVARTMADKMFRAREAKTEDERRTIMLGDLSVRKDEEKGIEQARKAGVMKTLTGPMSAVWEGVKAFLDTPAINAAMGLAAMGATIANTMAINANTAAQMSDLGGIGGVAKKGGILSKGKQMLGKGKGVLGKGVGMLGKAGSATIGKAGISAGAGGAGAAAGLAAAGAAAASAWYNVYEMVDGNAIAVMEGMEKKFDEGSIIDNFMSPIDSLTVLGDKMTQGVMGFFGAGEVDTAGAEAKAQANYAKAKALRMAQASPANMQATGGAAGIAGSTVQSANAKLTNGGMELKLIIPNAEQVNQQMNLKSQGRE